MTASFRGIEVASANYDPKAKTFALYTSDGDLIDEISPGAFKSQPQLRKLRHTNGRHRKSSSQIYSRPARLSRVTVDWGAAHSFASGGIVAGPWYTWASFNEPDPAIEHAGIRAGEVIGLRAWRVEGDRLFSVYIRKTEWPPRETLRGNSKDTRDEGIHAFKSLDEVKTYVANKRTSFFGYVAVTMSFDDDGNPVFEAVPHKERKGAAEVFVLGTVALWGEIVEHERGWRAEFAKVKSLDHIDGGTPEQLETLRARYGVGASVGSAA